MFKTPENSILTWRQWKWLGILTIAEGLVIIFGSARRGTPGWTLGYLMEKAAEVAEKQ